MYLNLTPQVNSNPRRNIPRALLSMRVNIWNLNDILCFFQGHADSWELGHPGILTKCNTLNGLMNKQGWNYGPMNPIKEEVYTFLTSFFKEVATIFPDKLMHLGGDEVGTSCW